MLVTDLNDHSPRFVNDSAAVGEYEVWLDESPVVPREILAVRAIDDDGHAGGGGGEGKAALRYWLTSAPSMPAAHAARFRVEPDGVVLSSEELDYERAPLPDHTYRCALLSSPLPSFVR